MKRLFDVFFVLLCMVLLIPIFIGAIVIIFFSDGLPIFYIQERVGKHGKVFNLYKFRTMRKDSDKLGFTTARNDERIFFSGRFIRRYKIDEIPQLLNILKGQMSIVGPRPTVLEDYNKMTSQEKQRCNIAPGLTGLAQISGNTSLKWPERIKLDLRYIQKQSFLYDLEIIVKTFWMIISNTIDSDSNEDGEW